MNAPKTHAHFVRYPELFPARLSGERWGENSITIDFAGGPYRFDGLSMSQLAAIQPAFGSLLVATESANVTVSIFRAAGSDFLPPVFDRGIYELAFTYASSTIAVSGPSFMGRVELTDGMRAAVWTSAESESAFPIVFENFFRLIVAYRLLLEGGLLLHSAGVVADGQASILFGPSGAGKSTAARLSLEAGYTILSDDLNAVARVGDSFEVAQVPFAGDLGRVVRTCERVPLRNVFRLQQGSSHRKESLAAGQGVAMLVAAAPFVNMDPYRADTLLDVALDLVDRRPIETLHFKKDAGFMRVVEAS